ncbi:hypothetical protein NQ317_013380 [Molorchus minor]|uniref:Uncharacterized protein n=1 Tax=Molorchus minor TaxID=1323400 RepID=A0ABQ9ITE3_9CUCU|nr:hypothetical protein NQ317_013380 [Molorchus minor]
MAMSSETVRSRGLWKASRGDTYRAGAELEPTQPSYGHLCRLSESKAFTKSLLKTTTPRANAPTGIELHQQQPTSSKQLTVAADEVQAYIDTQDSSCGFVETSAKKNAKVDEAFYQLFVVANLPQEMAPNHHKRVSANFGAPCPLPPSTPSHHTKKYHLSVKRRLSDACGVVTPNVRRPSIRTDLMIMRTKTCSLGDNPNNSSSSPIRWSRTDGRCSLQ